MQKKPNWYSTFEMLTDLLLTSQTKSKELSTDASFRLAFANKRNKVIQLITQLPEDEQREMGKEIEEWKKKFLDKKV